jgi:hypothetical protein
MIPDTEVFRDSIDISAIAIAVKNKLKLIDIIAKMFIGQFAPHHVRRPTPKTKE